MPSYDFGVNLQALIDAATHAGDAVRDLKDNDVHDFVPSDDALADDALAKAVDDFQDRWERGINNLVGDIEELAGRLAKVAMTYATLDSNSAEQITTAASGLSPAPSP